MRAEGSGRTKTLAGRRQARLSIEEGLRSGDRCGPRHRDGSVLAVSKSDFQTGVRCRSCLYLFFFSCPSLVADAERPKDACLWCFLGVASWTSCASFKLFVAPEAGPPICSEQRGTTARREGVWSLMSQDRDTCPVPGAATAASGPGVGLRRAGQLAQAAGQTLQTSAARAGSKRGSRAPRRRLKHELRPTTRNGRRGRCRTRRRQRATTRQASASRLSHARSPAPTRRSRHKCTRRELTSNQSHKSTPSSQASDDRLSGLVV